MKKINAVVYTRKGKSGKLVCELVDMPVPGRNEVLVKVAASSVNAADYRSMKMGLIPKNRIFGADIAGTVEIAGPGIQRFQPGDEVMGELSGCGFGGFAEYVAVHEDVLIPKPREITFEEAAALPLAGVTALQALRAKGNIRRGSGVLIVGSSGGVGSFALQLARYYGAEITAVCSTRNVERSFQLGAGRVIDYTKEDITAGDMQYDLIVAVNGNHSLSTYREMLKPNGICVMAGGALPQIIKFLLLGWLYSTGTKKMRSLSAKTTRTDLELIAKLAAEGRIKPVIDRRYSLEKVPEAMQYAGAGHATGKVIINIH